MNQLKKSCFCDQRGTLRVRMKRTEMEGLEVRRVMLIESKPSSMGHIFSGAIL